MFWIKLALLLPQGLALREIMRDFAPTKEQVEKISKSKTRCVMPMANSGHGFVCEQDLEGSSMVRCLRCGQLFGSQIDPMQECTIKTQPYKWLFRMVSSVKVKVPRSWSTRTCRRLMLQVPRWLGSLSELPCIKKDSGRGYKRWCLLPQSADGRLVEVLNAEISEVDLDSMQYSAPYLNTELQPRALVGGVSMCQPPAVLLRARQWKTEGHQIEVQHVFQHPMEVTCSSSFKNTGG
ncbi:unnamed protein product [Durusdinium trenchii]|uniref:Uncharacterized protein n=1 Tax=Durusdinium trenchii TaxID=1381693 RepID=A0ABP0R992_9DINO